MLRPTVRAAIEALPCLLSTLITAFVVLGSFYLLITVALPGIFYSQAQETEAVLMPNVSAHGWNTLERARFDHGFATDQTPSAARAKAAKDNLVNR
jgi:hypothetical protein